MPKEEGDVLADSSRLPIPTRNGFRVLVAEDDGELRWLISRALRKDGLEVIEAVDGSDLLERVGFSLLDSLELDSIDLIVSDVRMPGWTGLEVLAGLSSAGCRTPVVLITAFGDPRTHAAAKRLGAVAILDKPFDMDELCAVVRRELRANRSLC